MLRFDGDTVNSNILKPYLIDNHMIAPLLPAPSGEAEEDAYRAWRDAKLAARPLDIAGLKVDVGRLEGLTTEEMWRVETLLCRCNMALLRHTNGARIEKVSLHRLGTQLGLLHLDNNLCADEDAISTLRVTPGGRGNEYVPYTNRALSWHTDGYYNSPERQVRAWMLLCAQDAAEGGENALLDPDILYILLRDEDPALIHALMHPNAMTIPANRQGETEIRPARRGPVLSLDPATGSLHMRYSARARHVEWRDDAATMAALEFITGLLSSDSTYIYRHRLRPGECLVTNNVLHNRTAFRDDPARPRVLYRARYYERAACRQPIWDPRDPARI
jgi:Taurine catabolism dioxygenase TauD, TfdA family